MIIKTYDLRASFSEIISSCSFSPVRIPMISSDSFRATTFAGSRIIAEGMRGTNILPLCVVESINNKLECLWECDPELSHPVVSYGNSPARGKTLKNWKQGATTSHDISVTNNGESRRRMSGVVVSGNKQLEQQSFEAR